MSSLWIDFVNSDSHDPLGRDPDRDRLLEPDWVRRFLVTRKLPPIDVRLAKTRSALVRLRGLLQGFVQTIIKERSLRPADLAALNRYLAARPVTSRLEIADDSFHVRLVPTAKGLDGVLFAIAESFAAFLTDGDPTRLKTCENGDCRWVFYDTTRSRTRRWCADSCGNLVKVREFRRKKRKRSSKKRRRQP